MESTNIYCFTHLCVNFVFYIFMENKYSKRITCSDRVTRIRSKKCEAGVSASKIGSKKFKVCPENQKYRRSGRRRRIRRNIGSNIFIRICPVRQKSEKLIQKHLEQVKELKN